MSVFLVRVLRLLLVAAAGYYLWMALRRPPGAAREAAKRSDADGAHPVQGETEDIDYEDIP